MRFASNLVKLLFLFGTTECSEQSEGKIITMDLEKASHSIDGNIMPSEIRKIFSEKHEEEIDAEASLEKAILEGHLSDMVNVDTKLLSAADTKIVTKDLKDFHDVQVFTKIYVGENKQSFYCIFDTGSNWLWVQSKHCVNCPVRGGFDEDESASYVLKKRDEPTVLRYGSGWVMGWESEDQVCMSRE